MENIRLSLVIPAKSKDDLKLKELLVSIDRQDFPKDEMETLVITKGTSESAKAIGIQQAKGKVIGILASDNELVHFDTLAEMTRWANWVGASYPRRYAYFESDNILNRYFSLIGGNDALSFYMNKNDRISYLKDYSPYPEKGRSFGDNGFFVKKSEIEKTDLDNYYHVDNANEIECNICAVPNREIWHKTGGNIFKFFAKRYRYGLQHAFNKNRRWHLVDFSKPKDIWRLIWFILATITIIQPTILSIRGWFKIQDKAWFLHPVVCILTLITYTVLICHLGLVKLYRLLFAPMVVQKA